MAAATIGVLVAGHHWLGYEWEAVRTMVFTALVLVQLAYSYVIRRSGRVAGERNRLLLLAVLASIALQSGVVYLPIGQTLFETVALPIAAWLPIVAAAFVAALGVIASDLAVGRRRKRITPRR
jgi:magnesium-transporting ATPase (P-type)